MKFFKNFEIIGFSVFHYSERCINQCHMKFCFLINTFPEFVKVTIKICSLNSKKKNYRIMIAVMPDFSCFFFLFWPFYSVCLLLKSIFYFFFFFSVAKSKLLLKRLCFSLQSNSNSCKLRVKRMQNSNRVIKRFFHNCILIYLLRLLCFYSYFQVLVLKRFVFSVPGNLRW